MKVLWFTNILLPEFAEAIGMGKGDLGGWMPALVSALRKYAPKLELHVVSEGPEGKSALVNGIHYYAIGKGRIGRGGRCPNAAFAQNAKRLIGQINPDVIHVHGSEGPYADFPADVWQGRKVVVSIQGIISAYYYYYGNLAESDLLPYRNRLREFLKGYSVKAERTYWKSKRSVSERNLLRDASLILGRTSWDKAWARYIAPEKTYAYVGEILREPFYSSMRDAMGLVPHSLYCGAALSYPLKNGHVLLEAVASLKKKYPDVVLHVANAVHIKNEPGFVGRLREGEYVRYVRDEIKRLGISNNLVLHPSLSASDVRQLLEKTEVFCLPSACENSPNSLGEAMLTGTPSVATYVGGTPSILENGREGILVPSGDPAVFADAIDRLFSDREMAQSYASAAYETAVKRYDPEAVVTQLMSAYNSARGGAS